MDELLYAPLNGPSAKSPQRAVLERVVVTDQSGRVFDLGCPNSRLFRLRVIRYRWQRRAEFRAAKGS